MNEFVRSSRCESTSCVEVSVNQDKVVVRNSTQPEVTVEFTPQEWAAFIEGVQAGEFRRP